MATAVQAARSRSSATRRSMRASSTCGLSGVMAAIPERRGQLDDIALGDGAVLGQLVRQAVEAQLERRFELGHLLALALSLLSNRLADLLRQLGIVLIDGHGDAPVGPGIPCGVGFGLALGPGRLAPRLLPPPLLGRVLAGLMLNGLPSLLEDCAAFLVCHSSPPCGREPGQSARITQRPTRAKTK